MEPSLRVTSSLRFPTNLLGQDRCGYRNFLRPTDADVRGARYIARIRARDEGMVYLLNGFSIHRTHG